MAQTLYVTEYALLPGRGSGWAPLAVQPPVVLNNNVTVTASHAESAAFNALTNMIRVHLDSGVATGASIQIGAAPVAIANQDARMAVNQTEYFLVVPGHKLSVIADTV
jgi:hypothetical protein